MSPEYYLLWPQKIQLGTLAMAAPPEVILTLSSFSHSVIETLAHTWLKKASESLPFRSYYLGEMGRWAGIVGLLLIKCVKGPER